MSEEVTYTINQLGRISGISKQQLIAWDRDGLLRAERRHRGKVWECAYTRDQALGVIALGELRRSGISTRHIRRASAALPMSIGVYQYLVFDGRMIYARATAEEVLDLLKGTDKVRVLRVSQLARRLVV